MGTRQRYVWMVSRVFMQQATRMAMSWSTASSFCRAGSLFLLLLSGLTLVAQQPRHPATSREAEQSSKPSPNLQRADELRRQGLFDQARGKVQEELQRNPASVEAYNMLGFIYLDEKDYSHAVEAFQQALKVAPGSAKTRNNLGNVYMTEQKSELAEKEFRTVLRTDPGNRDANYNLGLLLMLKGSAGEAIAHFERVRPATVATQFNLIHAYLASNRTAEGLRLANELSAQNKDNIQLHFSLGTMLASEKQYKPAQLELEKADALQPGTFEILYNLGQAYLRAGANSKAEFVLNRALKLKPDSPDTLHLLAQVYSNESRPLDALDLLVRAHKIAPENTDVILLMARVSMSQNYYEDAIPLLESGVAIAPQRADLLAALGESYFMAGKVDKAIEQFQKLIKLDPSARSYVYLGISYRHLGRFDEAKQYFQDGLKLDPHNSACLFNLGFIAERQGDDAKAEAMFQQALRSNPDHGGALLELANLRIASKKYAEAADLLRKYVEVSHSPATGYYKLAMVERSLHQTEAADRDLKVFQTLSKDVPTGPYPYEHLFDNLDNRSKLAPQAQNQYDITQLQDEISKHPDQPEDLYLLAEAYLKTGKKAEAKDTIAQLDKLSAGDYRTLTGVGVLLARYHLYDDAIQHFRDALQANPGSDEVIFNIADAYFRKGQYADALSAAGQVSEQGRKDNAYLALLGDIYAHLGDTTRATQVYEDALTRNPDNDQDYLSLSLLQLRENSIAEAKQTLLRGQARVPSSGKILWGLGIVSALEGNTPQAADQLARAVDLLPEWPGSYSTLGVFYFETGQIDKAKEVLNRFKNSSKSGALDIDRIEQVLAQAPATSPAAKEPMTMANRQQLLQLALSLADRTL
jgi:tetratricopeptide (TPR) repeat protein